jgi:putative endonuclease
MADFHDVGQKGEEKAVGHLIEKGYQIVKRNWRKGKYEVDIIAENTDYLIFVEVKTRSENFLHPPASAITEKKQTLLEKIADSYIRSYKINKECRFDVITVIKKENFYIISENIEGAFYPTLKF